MGSSLFIIASTNCRSGHWTKTVILILHDSKSPSFFQVSFWQFVRLTWGSCSPPTTNPRCFLSHRWYSANERTLPAPGHLFFMELPGFKPSIKLITWKKQCGKSIAQIVALVNHSWLIPLDKADCTKAVIQTSDPIEVQPAQCSYLFSCLGKKISLKSCWK